MPLFQRSSSDVDNNAGIVKSPEALRPFTLRDCDCEILTTAICRGLHGYIMRCVHRPKRCIESTQMTDNIFEVETTALTHVACAFAATYPSVNYSWISHMLFIVSANDPMRQYHTWSFRE